MTRTIELQVKEEDKTLITKMIIRNNDIKMVMNSLYSQSVRKMNIDAAIAISKFQVVINQFVKFVRDGNAHITDGAYVVIEKFRTPGSIAMRTLNRLYVDMAESINSIINNGIDLFKELETWINFE